MKQRPSIGTAASAASLMTRRAARPPAPALRPPHPAPAPSRTRCARRSGATGGALLFQVGLQRRTFGLRLQLPRLRIQAADRLELFLVAQPGLAHGGLEHADGVVQHLGRHREGMPVLAAMGQREPRRIAEAARRAVQHLGHHRQRAHGARAHAGHLQQRGEVLRPLLGGRGQAAVQPAQDDVLGAHIVMVRQRQMRLRGRIPGLRTGGLRRRLGEQVAGDGHCGLGPRAGQALGRGRRRRRQASVFARDLLRAQRLQQRDLRRAGAGRAAIGQVDDRALARALDGRVRRIDEVLQPFGQPVIATRLPAGGVHALLHHHPLAVVADDEAVQIQVEPVLHRRAVHLGHQPAGARQRRAVHAGALAHRQQLVGRGPRMPAAPAAHMQAQLARQRRQPALERADHAGGDAGGMPVHAHHRAEGLEPERMGQPPQQLVAPIAVDDGLAHHRAQPGHALAQPRRYAPAMQGKIGAAAASGHGACLIAPACRSRVSGHEIDRAVTGAHDGGCFVSYFLTIHGLQRRARSICSPKQPFERTACTAPPDATSPAKNKNAPQWRGVRASHAVTRLSTPASGSRARGSPPGWRPHRRRSCR
ncbi:hypothetical protein QE438_001410 [Pseudoxanthomonas sp. SORGH_AS 997]|nr:hypothetical protein [Pseudoxanthomonas sp. SORGH_AS_0997]